MQKLEFGEFQVPRDADTGRQAFTASSSSHFQASTSARREGKRQFRWTIHVTILIFQIPFRPSSASAADDQIFVRLLLLIHLHSGHYLSDNIRRRSIRTTTRETGRDKSARDGWSWRWKTFFPARQAPQKRVQVVIVCGVPHVWRKVSSGLTNVFATRCGARRFRPRLHHQLKPARRGRKTAKLVGRVESRKSRCSDPFASNKSLVCRERAITFIMMLESSVFFFSSMGA